MAARHSLSDAALGAAILALWAAWALWLWWGHWPSDLGSVYFAARFFAEGSMPEVYASPARFFGEDYPASWLAAVAASGHGEERVFPYIYPPLWAALVAPLADRVSPTMFFNGVYVWHVGLLATAPVLVYRLFRPPVPFAVFAALSALILASSVFVRLALFQNQIQITVAVLTLLAFERISRGRDLSGGAALGLAAALKLMPVVLVLIFAAERRWRACAATLLTMALLAAASLALAGPEMHAVYLGKLRLVSEQLYIWHQNFSLEAVLFMAAAALDGHAVPSDPETGFLFQPPEWLSHLTRALMLAGLGAVLWATRGLPEPPRLAARLAAGGIVVALCSPLAWAHHFAATVLLLPGLLALRPTPAALAWIGATVVLFATPVIHAAPYYLDPNLLLVAAVAWLGALALVFARPAGVSRTSAATVPRCRT